MSEVWHYFSQHQDTIAHETWTTIWLAALPLIAGTLLALPFGWWASRVRWLYLPLITSAGILYTIPSIVLFVTMPGLLGTKILDPVNVAIALAVYTFALMVRVSADAFGSVSSDTMASAAAMGFTTRQRLLSVQLPIAVPVLGAGIRVAAVSNVSLVSVASTIGVTQLGSLFIEGDANNDLHPIILALILFVLLALVFDGLVLLGIRALTPVAAGGGEPMTGRILAGGSGLPSLSHVPTWLTNSDHWHGSGGIPELVQQQLTYTVLALAVATLVGLPLGLLIGHTGRGAGVIGGLANAARAVPILGLLLLLIVWLSPKIHHTAAVPGLVQRGGFPYFVPLIIVLIVLAIPPILTNTYAGVQNVDPAVRDAARGMGMTGSEVVRKVELPCALPLIMSGFRSATLQVLATATIAAYVPLLGGLGTLIYTADQSITDPDIGYPVMVAAGLLVALLAVLVDIALSLVQRLIVSPGLTGRSARKARPVSPTSPDARQLELHH